MKEGSSALTNPGTLYVVSTPIGNLEDITLRALRILKSVALIAAEDTRHTRKLLTHFGIKARLTSYFEHNEQLKAGEIIEALKNGSDVALVSDAGTPGISDPGYRLIGQAIENAAPVVPVPGASALLSVLSVSGMPIDAFTFLGFPPSGDAARKRFFLETLAFQDHTFVIYESARRLKETLISMRSLLGDVHVCMGREMTKAHEEVLRGALSAVIGALDGRDRELKGEVTLVFRTLKKDKAVPDVPAEILRLLDAGVSVKDAVKAVSAEFDLPRGEVYREALKVKGCF